MRGEKERERGRERKNREKNCAYLFYFSFLFFLSLSVFSFDLFYSKFLYSFPHLSLSLSLSLSTSHILLNSSYLPSKTLSSFCALFSFIIIFLHISHSLYLLCSICISFSLLTSVFMPRSFSICSFFPPVLTLPSPCFLLLLSSFSLIYRSLSHASSHLRSSSVPNKAQRAVG